MTMDMVDHRIGRAIVTTVTTDDVTWVPIAHIRPAVGVNRMTDAHGKLVTKDAAYARWVTDMNPAWVREATDSELAQLRTKDGPRVGRPGRLVTRQGLLLIVRRMETGQPELRQKLTDWAIDHMRAISAPTEPGPISVGKSSESASPTSPTATWAERLHDITGRLLKAETVVTELKEELAAVLADRP
jgi:hypothetical protein